METSEAKILEEAPAIPGLRIRNYESEQDFAQMAAVANAAAAADGVERVENAQEMANEYLHIGNDFNLKRDVLIAEVDGQVVAYSRIRNWQVVADHSRIYSVVGFVDPQWRHKGLGRAMLRANERRAREIASTHPGDGAKLLGSSCDENEQGALALLAQEGYRPVRHSYRMIRPDLENIPDLPLPYGLEVRPVRPEDVRAIWDAVQEAFQDHWGHVAPSEDWFQGYLASGEFQPDLWQVAWSGDQVVGTVLCFINHEENQHFGILRGWTEDITVRRPWRGQGVAKALIVHGLRALKERGMKEAALGVDTENQTGALHLYESMGYIPVARETAFRKKME